jgi:hypothetical protein
MADVGATTRVAVAGGADDGGAGGGAGAGAGAPSPAPGPAASEATPFTFEPTAKDWVAFTGKEARDGAWWAKWGLSGRLSTACVRVGGRRFDPAEAPAFLADLFNAPAVRAALPLHGRRGPVSWGGPVTSVTFTQLRTAATTMAFFDRLVDAGAVTADGHIRKRLDEDIAGVTVSDLLRQALLDPDGESPSYTGDHDFAGVFPPEDRAEALYVLLRWVATGGGALCQYEDEWGPYLAAVKAVYRDLVTVTRSAPDAPITVASHVYAVSAVAGPRAGPGAATTTPLFPDGDEHGHSICLVSVDPIRRTANILYHAWVGW